ncbi:MAG TPA: hypothetical protein VF883_16370 [Thermoanaerobaculia bacterium]|jgi:hypothetical protein
MNFELQTICIIRPAYFRIAVLLLLATTIASGISAVIATAGHIRGAKIVSPHVKKFHVGVVLVWVIYAAVVVLGSIHDRGVLREYEQTTGRVAPAVRAAMNRETRTVATFGAECAVVGMLSMLAWRGMDETRSA